MAKLLPFPTALARYRQWRDAFLDARPKRLPARVIGIHYLRWKRYGEWRRRRMSQN